MEREEGGTGGGSAPTAPSSPVSKQLTALVRSAQRAAESQAFFQPLLILDEELRTAAVEDCVSDLRVSALRKQEKLRAHLLAAVRLGTSSPFEDVRNSFVALMQFLRKETEFSAPAAEASRTTPSRFVPESALVPLSGGDDGGDGSGAAKRAVKDEEEEEEEEKGEGDGEEEEGVEDSDEDDEDEEGTVGELLQSIFLRFGRVSNVHRVLAWHPSYLRAVVETDTAIMRDRAALPRSWRRYLAVLAAARHTCTPLIEAQATAFVQEGGDPSWLLGLKHAPQQFANLAELNALVAHRPWLITADHIATLVRGDGSWSVTELVTALVVLTTFHAQSIFVWGMGIESEVDMRCDTDVFGVTAAEDAAAAAAAAATATTAGAAPAPASVSATPADIAGDASATAATAAVAPPADGDGTGAAAGAGGGAGAGSSTLVVGGGGSGGSAASARFEASRTSVDFGEDQLKDRLMAGLSKLMGEGDDDAVEYERAFTAQISVESTSLPSGEMSQLCGHPLRYINFDNRKHKVLKTQDYSWEDHGYAMVSRYFPAAASLLDTQFSVIYHMTYETFSTDCGIDTMPFRRAIWNYVHCIFGIRNDDYTYREVNVFLSRAVKGFVKKLTCFPESVTKRDFDDFSAVFGPDEKCHICLLALEARKQAALAHALNAIMRFVK